MNKFAKITLWIFSLGMVAFAVLGLVKIGGKGSSVYWVDGSYGFVDKNGTMVIEPKFDLASDFHEGLALIMDEYEQYGFIDRNGNVVIEPQFEDALGFSEGLAAVQQTYGRYGYIDKTGEFAIEPIYHHTYRFFDGMGVVQMGLGEDARLGYVDKEGRLIIPQFEVVGAFDEGLAPVAIGDHYGYIDKTGQMVIEPQFDDAYSFSEGLARVGMIGKNAYDEDVMLYGFIDRTGHMVVEPQFRSAGNFSEGLCPVARWYTYGYIDKTGQMVIPPHLQDANSFAEGLALVKKDDLYGYIDKTGQKVIVPQFDIASDFLEGLALVWVDSLGGNVLIDMTGEVVLSKKLLNERIEISRGVSEGLCLVEKKGGCGLKNWLGVHKTEAVYDYIRSLDNGLYSAEDHNGYSLLNKRGKVLLTNLDMVYDFNDELAEVEIDGLSGFVNKRGKWAVDPQFDEIGYYDSDSDRARVMKDGLYGYIDGKGQVVIDFQFDEAWEFDKGEAEVVSDGKRMYIDPEGNTLKVLDDVSDDVFGSHLLKKEEVTILEDNPLNPMPQELNLLVAGTDVDLRNSLYSIVQGMVEYNGLATLYFDNDEIDEYMEYGIFQNMVDDPAIYNEYVKDYNRCIGAMDVDYVEEYDNPCYDSIETWGPTWKSQFIDRLLRSERLQNVLFAWTKPMLKKAFGSDCSLPQRVCLASAVNHMIDYTAHYDHQAEKEFYQACVADGSVYWFNSPIFSLKASGLSRDEDNPNPYRRLETWVYRRVEEQSMSAAQIHDWLMRIRTELNMGGLQELDN